MVTTFYRSGQTGIRERLLDQIVQRYVAYCPTLALLPREQTNNVLTEWMLHAPFDPSDAIRNSSNPHATAKLENDSFTDIDELPQTKIRCITEIKSRSFKMSGTNMVTVAAGQESTWDYTSGQVYVQALNDFDNTALFGMGGPEVAGTAITRKTQGLISHAMVTGLERMHGTGVPTSITDPYGISIPKRYWSVAYNANHSNLTPDMLYNHLVIPLGNNGAIMSPAWVMMMGDRMMGRVARFNEPGPGIKLEERTRSASEPMVADYIRWFKFPNGVVMGFVSNRWMDRPELQYTYGAFSFTPGTPATPSSVASTTVDGDSIGIAWQPGNVRILWLRPPSYELLPSSVDGKRMGVVLEGGVQVDHPLCVGAVANALA
jgi:hypothetical protein